MNENRDTSHAGLAAINVDVAFPQRFRAVVEAFCEEGLPTATTTAAPGARVRERQGAMEAAGVGSTPVLAAKPPVLPRELWISDVVRYRPTVGRGSSRDVVVRLLFSPDYSDFVAPEASKNEEEYIKARVKEFVRSPATSVGLFVNHFQDERFMLSADAEADLVHRAHDWIARVASFVFAQFVAGVVIEADKRGIADPTPGEIAIVADFSWTINYVKDVDKLVVREGF